MMVSTATHPICNNYFILSKYPSTITHQIIPFLGKKSCLNVTRLSISTNDDISLPSKLTDRPEIYMYM